MMKLLLVLACLVAASAAAGIGSRERADMTPSMMGWMTTGGLQAYEDKVRIVGGAEAEQHSRTFQVGLFVTMTVGGTGFCGGSILTSTRVLTAAHCWFDGQNQGASIQAVFGAHVITAVEPQAVRMNLGPEHVIVHPDWTPSAIRNDLAMLVLPTALTFNEFIQPVNLPSGSQVSESFAGDVGKASGWGRPSDSVQTISSELREVDLDIISQLVCRIRFPTILQPENLCTSGADGKGTCQGDSGGPLTVERNGQTVLVGVTSFGLALGCEINWPAVFARVTGFMPWIMQNI